MINELKSNLRIRLEYILTFIFIGVPADETRNVRERIPIHPVALSTKSEHEE